MRFLRFSPSLPLVTSPGPSIDTVPGIEPAIAHGGKTDSTANLASVLRRTCLLARLAAVATALIAVCLLAVPAHAATGTTYTVTTLADVIDASPACTTQTGTTCSLRDAITLANANSGSTIVFLPGLAGTLYFAESIPLPTISTNMTILGPGANLLTLDFQGTSHRILPAGNVSLSISGMTLLDGGQAIELQSNADATVDRCVITQFNDSALAVFGGSHLTVTNSLIYGNPAQGNELGAGINNYGGTLTIANSTITGNTAGGNGGGIYNSGTATITNSTITGNTSASGGGGIFNAGGTVTIVNSIVSGNNSNGGANSDDCDSCGTQSANNLIGGTSAVVSPLAWNGGPTKTMLPYAGTVIGKGSYVTGEPATDQRGFPRPTSGAIDLGAVQSHYLEVITTKDTDDGSCTATACSFRDALEQAATDGEGDIQFNAYGTIFLNLAKPLPTIAENLNIAGPGASKLTIDGGQSSTVGSILTIEEEKLVAISGVTIVHGNTAATIDDAGGAITSYGELMVSNSVISANASASFSGGIVSDGEWLLVDSTTISGNTGAYGGAIENKGGSIVVVNNSTLSGNTANGGGGISSYGGAVLVNNSTIAGNSATDDASGGIYYHCPTSGSSCEGVIVNNSTVSANTGGIDNATGTAVTLYNSIVAGNTTSDTGSSGDCPNCGTQSKYNFIGGNPQLTPLQLTGAGATQEVMVPMPGSPVMGAGSWIIATSGPIIMNEALYTDERGFPRPSANSYIDLGAVQTNYTGVIFIAQPGNAIVGQNIAPAPVVGVTETNPANQNEDDVAGIPITLTFSGGSSEVVDPSSLTVTSASATNGGALFGGIAINVAGTGYTFTVASPVLGSTKVTSNTFNVLALAATPTFSPAAGTYTSAQTVTITSATPSASIYYTTDGSMPTTGSSLVDGPVTVSSTETIQAFAVATGFADSTVASAAYIIPPTFTLAVAPTALTVPGGQSGTAMVSVTPQNGFSSAVSFTCSGLPTGATCTFVPATVTPSGMAASTKLTVTTSAATAELHRNSNPLLPQSTLAVVLCCFLGWKKRRNIQLLLLLAVSVIGLSLFTGCGGGSKSTTTTTKTTPPVTSTVTVTGTSGSGSTLVQNTTTFSLTVN
ncbi:MAG: choice-of-anchor Q domain-containing protein [Terracidiphilus sp.]